jgi:CheY-like chemotaxis protein
VSPVGPEPSEAERQVADVMEAARRHYLAASVETVRAFDEIAAGLAARPDDAVLLGALRRELHRVQGTAGTVGFLEAGSLAGAMSATARGWESDPAVDRDRRSQTIEAFARLLREALTEHPSSGVNTARRLLLMDLPADVAAPLVAAAVRRGIAAERVTSDELEQAVSAPNCWGVVARGMSAGSAAAIGVPRVLLRDGSTTSETLPARTYVLDRRSAPDDVLDVLDELSGVDARDESALARNTDPVDAATAPDVIVIEDDAALADVISFALSAQGLSHGLYHTGPEGLSALLRLQAGGRPPVVLLDIDLPGLDGHSLHEQLMRARPGAFRVVFMSGHAGEEDQLRALKHGAVDYLVKPFSLRILMAKLAGWLEQPTAPPLS